MSTLFGRATRPVLSVPVREDGEPVRRTVVFAPSWEWYDTFRYMSGVRPDTRLMRAGTWRALAGMLMDGTDVVFYECSEADLNRPQRAWFDRWCAMAMPGMVRNFSEAARLVPNIVENVR